MDSQGKDKSNKTSTRLGSFLCSEWNWSLMLSTILNAVIIDTYNIQDKQIQSGVRQGTNLNPIKANIRSIRGMI